MNYVNNDKVYKSSSIFRSDKIIFYNFFFLICHNHQLNIIQKNRKTSKKLIKGIKIFLKKRETKRDNMVGGCNGT